MKKIVLIFLLLGTTTLLSQEIPSHCFNKRSQDLYRERGRMIIKVKYSAYGIYFDNSNSCITEELKNKIIRLYKAPYTNYIQFDKKNEATLEIIISTNNEYFLYQPNHSTREIKL